MRETYQFRLTELEQRALKPCPFCGRSDELSVNISDGQGTVPWLGEEGYAAVMCCECGAQGAEVAVHKDKDWKDRVVELWNTRLMN